MLIFIDIDDTITTAPYKASEVIEYLRKAKGHKEGWDKVMEDLK